jgi:hypothetical protein
MSDFYANQNASAPNIVLAHTLVGEPVDGKLGIASGGDIQPAGRWSTAPYKPPRIRRRDSKTVPHCVTEGCRAYQMKTLEYCSAHARSLGLVDDKFQLIEADDDNPE